MPEAPSGTSPRQRRKQGPGRHGAGAAAGGEWRHHRDSRKRIRSARSSGVIATTRSRAGSRAAMPQHGFQQRARTAVVQPGRAGIDGLGQADAPQRRRAPFAAVGQAVADAVGQVIAHVVHQHVGVRPDQLETVLGLPGIAAGDVLGHVAGHAIGLVEQLLARQHARFAGVAPLRHGQVGGVDGDEVHQQPAPLRDRSAAARRAAYPGSAAGRACSRPNGWGTSAWTGPCRWRRRRRFAVQRWAGRPSG